MTQRRIVVAPARPCRRSTVTYTAGEIDVFRPLHTPADAPLPAVLFVTGYADPGFVARMGCLQKDMASYVSWAELVASAGLAAVTYSNGRPEDVWTVLSHLDDHGARYGIDTTRLGVWGCSGNAPAALGLIRRTQAHPGLRCAVLCYGYLLDLGDATDVADAARTWGFANPLAGAQIDDLRTDVPLSIVRAGHDEMPGLNASLDRFVVAARGAGLSIELVDHAEAPHAFDLSDASEATRTVIEGVVEFFLRHLAGGRAARSG
jgi:hypothetical protein